MQIPLLFGTGRLEFHVQGTDRPWIIRREREEAVCVPSVEIRRGFTHPIRSPALAELAQGRRHACIVVSDNTRASPTPLLLEAILDELQGLVPRITVLVATGLHAPLTESQLQELVGPRASRSCEIACHDARDERSLVFMGSTPRGLPILVNRSFVESDLRVLTGLVEPHFMAGYSGGRKSVCPGILGQRSIQFFHSPVLLQSPNADYGILTGNPVHEEAQRVARAVGVDFIANAALDWRQQVARVSTGDLEVAWLDCVQFVQRRAQVAVPRRFDIVITSNGGYPLDRNYYQAVKGLVAAARIVRPGGIIILAAECRDGLGSDDFRRNLRALMAMGSVDAYLSYISEEAHWTIDQWEVEMLAKVLRRVSSVFLYSPGISREDLSVTLAQGIASLEEGLHEARARLGENATVAVMPEGPYLIPFVKCEETAAGPANLRVAAAKSESPQDGVARGSREEVTDE
jgi:nickel-dependent lactate racemase